MNKAIFDVRDAKSFYEAIKMNKLVGWPEDEAVVAELDGAYKSHIDALKLPSTKDHKYLFFRGALIGATISAKLVQHRLFVLNEEKTNKDKLDGLN